ncbi:MAG: glycosyltransferase family 2 protein [Acidimicrobiales bacterium]
MVSVIIPVRDRHDLLVACLDGLGAQTYQAFEVVVVDDGSTDGSAEAAGAHECGAHTVRVVRLGRARGAVAARVAGVAAAAGEILAFTDSDCVPAPSWLERLVAAVDAGADVVQGRTEPTRPPRPLERTVWGVHDDGLFATCNVAYRRSAYDRAGGFDVGASDRLGYRFGGRAQGLGFGEDTILGWRVRRTGTARFEPDAVVRHHVFPADGHELLSRSLQAGAFPALVREVPELRSTLLDGRLFLGTTRLPLYAAAGLALLGRRRVALGPLIIWLLGHWRRLRTSEPDPHRRLIALAATCGMDVVEAAALLAGSASSRTLVM